MCCRWKQAILDTQRVSKSPIYLLTSGISWRDARPKRGCSIAFLHGTGRRPPLVEVEKSHGNHDKQHSSTANGTRMEILAVSEVASQRCSVLLLCTRRWRKQLQKAWTQQTLSVDPVNFVLCCLMSCCLALRPVFVFVWCKFNVLVPDSTYSWNSLTFGES